MQKSLTTESTESTESTEKERVWCTRNAEEFNHENHEKSRKWKERERIYVTHVSSLAGNIKRKCQGGENTKGDKIGKRVWCTRNAKEFNHRKHGKRETLMYKKCLTRNAEEFNHENHEKSRKWKEREDLCNACVLTCGEYQAKMSGGRKH